MIDPRSHISEGLNRARLRLEVRRGTVPALTVAAFMALALAIFGYIVSHVTRSATARR